MTHAIGPCERPWWKRPPAWFAAIAAVLVLIFVVLEIDGRAPATPYGTFLDQLDAGNVASVSFQGTDIHGRFKHPVGDASSSGTAQRDVFRSHVPDFGDPTLIPQLRKQHVVIDVTSPSPWAWLLGRIPWPMLVFVAVVLVAAFARILRGGIVSPGGAEPTMPMHGMIGLLSGLFAKQPPAAHPPIHEGEESKRQ